ncbi:lysozyme inhibitor LprI family protein [Rhizobium sp. RCC_161_2]|uniref:lysozyme inhibitor LprI family protein n=1 Tax=Rhizobium sp. RCC_161_2 TaxID=3239219 RepID=UPI0035240882
MNDTQKYIAILLLSQFILLPADAGPLKDPTRQSLDACLQDPKNGSTGDQSACEVKALASYDKRMNVAYSKLLNALPPQAGQDLRAAQRGWIAYRDMEARARESLFATRQGSMYAPMQADAETDLTRDRTLLLESYLRVLDIDGP